MLRWWLLCKLRPDAAEFLEVAAALCNMYSKKPNIWNVINLFQMVNTYWNMKNVLTFSSEKHRKDVAQQSQNF